MPIALLLLAQAADDLVTRAKAMTAVTVRCVAADPAADPADVTVCGRRAADRYRVPLATRTADRRDDVVSGRAALLHRTTPVQDLSPFLVGGGMVGAHVGTSFGARGSRTTVRPLAP